MSSPQDLTALGGTAINAIGTIEVTKIAADTVSRSARGIKSRKVSKSYPKKSSTKSYSNKIFKIKSIL